jgi:hypothetical protein
VRSALELAHFLPSPLAGEGKSCGSRRVEIRAMHK